MIRLHNLFLVILLYVAATSYIRAETRQHLSIGTKYTLSRAYQQPVVSFYIEARDTTTNALVGGLRAHCMGRHKACEIDHISVDPAYQRSGIGGKLLKNFEQDPLRRKIHLSSGDIKLIAPNDAYLGMKTDDRQRFYEKNGYLFSRYGYEDPNAPVPYTAALVHRYKPKDTLPQQRAEIDHITFVMASQYTPALLEKSLTVPTPEPLDHPF